MALGAVVAMLVSGAVFLNGCVALPTAMEVARPDLVHRLPSAGKTLYLTIDDGPSAATSAILEVLRRHGVPATFFVWSDRVDTDSVAPIVADGHRLAHHLRDGRRISRMSLDEFSREFVAAEEVLHPFDPVPWFRPPHGAIDREKSAWVRERGYAIAIGTVFPLDHWLEHVPTIVALARLLAVDGGIVVLHDGAERGRRTAEALDRLISVWQRQGYRFELLPQPAAPIRTAGS